MCQLGKKWRQRKGLRYQGRNTLKHSNNFCDFASSSYLYIDQGGQGEDEQSVQVGEQVSLGWENGEEETTKREAGRV